MTKTIRYCDRCKKEIKNEDILGDMLRQARFPTFGLYGRFSLYSDVCTVDLCPSCSYDLDRLLKKFMEEKDDTPDLKDLYNCMMEDNKNDS